MGRRVECDIVEGDVEDEKGGPPRLGVTATCSRCDHTTESYGVGEGSRKRCLALLREECPRGEENFYVDDAADDD